jgi:phosphatidylserine decarboxylase
VTVWGNNPEGVKFWIKGDSFTMEEFLTSNVNSTQFNGGTLVLLRLAPQDYHRFHIPVPSSLLSIQLVEGTLQSVNADGMTSRNYAIYNQRTVMLFDSPDVGQYAYVAIGALCVGSVQIPDPASSASTDGLKPQAPIGTQYARGDDLGYFQFGGSTIALVFRPGVVRFDDDIIFASQRKVESLMQVKSKLGTIIGNGITGLQPT